MRRFIGIKMGQSESYKLELRSLPVGVQQFSYVVGDRFFAEMESPDIRSGEVEVAVTVTRKGDTFDLAFRVTGDVTIGCDRCLDDMPHHVDADYCVAVTYGGSADEDSDEVVVADEKERYFDLSRLIYDTIELSIPMKHVHAEGECNMAMAEKLRELSAERQDSDPRWGALKELLDNK